RHRRRHHRPGPRSRLPPGRDPKGPRRYGAQPQRRQTRRPPRYSRVMTAARTPDRVQWLSDLIRLEIVLWERIDTRLRAQHDLPLASFETLYFVARSPDGR